MMKRIVPGLLIAGFWLLLLLKGPTQLFCFVVIVIVLLGVDEYVKMADPRPLPLAERWLINLVISLPVFGACFVPGPSILPVSLIASFSALTCYFLYRYKDIADCYNLFCRHVFGCMYLGILGAYVIFLRYLPEGGSWLIIASAITASSDTGAYFVGRAYGKRKLCPNISPNKTIEGAAGGIISGVLAALIFASLLLQDHNWIFLCLSATVLCVVGIAGDLTESIIKRGTGTKDSGKCLGGHGGILDRVDSLLFVCPVLYYLLIFPVVG